MTEAKLDEFPTTHRAVRWHPPGYDVRVEDVPFPQWETFSRISLSDVLTPLHRIEHPDDAIVKITVQRVIADGSR